MWPRKSIYSFNKTNFRLVFKRKVNIENLKFTAHFACFLGTAVTRCNILLLGLSLEQGYVLWVAQKQC
jgi:hypothetical protein